MPEDSNTETAEAPTTEQQLSSLRKTIAGHHAFGICRKKGISHIPIRDMLKNLSPEKTLQAFEEWIAPRKVMLNMLAKLKRDGHEVAYEELLAALETDHIIIGETIPLDETEHGVFLMFDPEKTLLLARWMYTSTWEDGNNWVTNGRLDPERSPCGSLTEKLLEVFPDLRKTFEGKRNLSSRGDPVSPTKSLWPKIDDAWEKFEHKFGIENIRALWPDRRRTDRWEFGNAIGILVLGVSQQEVLSCFSRKEQESIATWCFNYPKVTRKEFSNGFIHPNMWIGFHPEDEHEQWRKQWPTYASNSVNQGLGAVLLDDEMIGDVQLGSNNHKPFTPYLPIRAIYPDFCQGDLDRRRIVLGFPCPESRY